MVKCEGYAALEAGAALEPYSFERRSPRPTDVVVGIEYCGVCHTDLGFVSNEWGFTSYPVVPGHEIVGKIVETGPAATRFKVGDRVAIGCMVNSCRQCRPCQGSLEQFCEQGPTYTYNGFEPGSDQQTFGGYSSHYVVDEHFVSRLPDGLDPAAAAPLLCAGITVYAPLKRFGAGLGRRVGVVGIGGLGHLGICIARALGAEVIAITTSPRKRDDALALGASSVLISGDPDQMASLRNTFDLILVTASDLDNLDQYLQLLDVHGVLCLVGAPAHPMPLLATSLILKGRMVAGSSIGGMAETQEMLDFCAAHDITALIEVIAMQDINTAFKRLEKGDVKYRFVIDMVR